MDKICVMSIQFTHFMRKIREFESKLKYHTNQLQHESDTGQQKEEKPVKWFYT